MIAKLKRLINAGLLHFNSVRKQIKQQLNSSNFIVLIFKKGKKRRINSGLSKNKYPIFWLNIFNKFWNWDSHSHSKRQRRLQLLRIPKTDGQHVCSESVVLENRLFLLKSRISTPKKMKKVLNLKELKEKRVSVLKVGNLSEQSQHQSKLSKLEIWYLSTHREQTTLTEKDKTIPSNLILWAQLDRSYLQKIKEWQVLLNVFSQEQMVV